MVFLGGFVGAVSSPSVHLYSLLLFLGGMVILTGSAEAMGQWQPRQRVRGKKLRGWAKVVLLSLRLVVLSLVPFLFHPSFPFVFPFPPSL